MEARRQPQAEALYMSGWVNGGIVQWGCWCGEKEKDFLCNHAGCEQAAEGNAGQELRCGTWCRRELETGVIPTELRAQVEKWRKFFHAKIQSVPVLCHVPLWSWGHGGRGGGAKQTPSLWNLHFTVGSSPYTHSVTKLWGREAQRERWQAENIPF